MAVSDPDDLGSRHRDILATIIRLYVATGIPVGSRAVAVLSAEPLSSATIRSVMAELESDGYLIQPHTSAGRIPADKAYRFYVDRLASYARLAPTTEKYIDDNLCAEPGPIQDLMGRVSKILSEVSKHLGVVLGPALEEKLLEQIKFVRLTDRRVLAVIVSKPDLIENKVFRFEDECTQEELDRAADFLNHEFRGWSLRTVRLEMVKRIEEMKQASDRLLRNVAKLFMWGALAEEAPGPLFVDGAARILDQPEFVDAGKVKDLIAAIEDKAKLVKILSACLEAPHRGVRALIGGENPNSEMQRCTLILAPYHYRQRPVGALGVLGPTRMEYDRAIKTVEYVAELTSRLLSAN
jgi:heat-inducible transcriptional repressor